MYAAKSGMVEEVMEEIASLVKQMKPHERYVTLSIDEMKGKKIIKYR